MARFRASPAGSWPVLFGIGTLAVVAWGIYAWRFSGDTADSVPSVAEASVPADEGDASGDLATLKATRPTQDAPAASDLPQGLNSEKANEDAGFEPSLGVNTAISIDNQTEYVDDEAAVNESDAPAAHSSAIALGDQLLATAKRELARGELVEARESLSRAVAEGLQPADTAYAIKELNRLADALIFSRATNTGDPLIDAHVVQSGESINTIAQKYQVTEDLLIQINRLSDPHQLSVGRRLKVIYGPFRAVIYKSLHRMDMYLGDTLVRSYRVGLGTNGGTPTGTWTVRNKLANPDWTNPETNQYYAADDPANPIGEYWIGLRGLAGEALGKEGFGIHGTIEPESIGENMSMGCVRLIPKDIEAVYPLFIQGSSQVEILP